MKKSLLTLGFLSLVATASIAQNKDAIKFSKAINTKDAYKHLSVLASDEYEGRETGRKGAWMAADFIRDYFKSLGLKAPVNGSYYQSIDLVEFKVNNALLTVDGATQNFKKDFFMSPMTVPQNGFTFSADEVVFVGYGLIKGEYNDFNGVDVAGKVIMMFNSGDPTLKAGERADRQQMMEAVQSREAYFASKGVKAVLLINPMLDNAANSSRFLNDTQMFLKTKSGLARLASQGNLPRISISSAVANNLLKSANTTLEEVKKQIAETKKPNSKVLNTPISASAARAEEPLRAENVLGFLEGSDPKLKEEVLVVTGHYDHDGLVKDPNAVDKVFNGADDDASGTTGVMLMAKAFSDAKKAGKGPKRSVLFMTVVGEEKGLWGSDWYSENPIYPLKNTIANLNIDMIGRIGTDYKNSPDSANYIYSIGSNMLSTDLHNISEATNKKYTKMKLDYKFDDPNDTERIYYRSDHYNFAKHGIPIIFYFNGIHEDYHKPSDEVHKIHFPLLVKRTQLAYYTAWELLNGAKRPVVDKAPDATRVR